MSLGGDLALAGAGGAFQLLGDRWNRKHQDKINEQNRAHDVKMYAMQRGDSLADWHMQNAYNSPEEQMNRLRQAGLNPNMVYGKGADNTAASISSSNPKSTPGQASPKSTDIVSNAINTFRALRLQQAQTDNINEQARLAQQEALLKQAQTDNVISNTAKTEFELQQAKELKDTTIQRAKLMNEQAVKDLAKTSAETQKINVDTEKTQADIKFTLDENERAALRTTRDLEYTFEKILTEKLSRAKTQSEIDNLKTIITINEKESIIKKAQSELAKKNIMPGDKLWERQLLNLVMYLTKEAAKKMGVEIPKELFITD